MLTLEIPRPEWSQFFRNFDALHRGWQCTIEILADSLGAQVQSHGLPLAGIGVDDAAHSRITVSLGTSPEAHLTHGIDAPRHVWILRDDAADRDILEIETADARTLLRFQHDLPDGRG